MEWKATHTHGSDQEDWDSSEESLQAGGRLLCCIEFQSRIGGKPRYWRVMT